MKKTTDDIIQAILNREGGFVNNPNDRGGPTKYGITLETLYRWRNKPTSVHDVRDLTIEEARQIYLHNYIMKPGYDKLGDPALIEQLIDAGVNHGVGNAIKILQLALRVDQDGSIGPKTLEAYHKKDPVDVVLLFIAARCRFYSDILNIRKNKRAESQWQFAAGWFNRVADMLIEYSESN